MRKSVLVTAIVIGCCGCSSQESKDIEAVKAEVLSQLRDPASAQFSNVRVVGAGIVCGDVNSKNAFGGYVGRQRFFGMASGDPPVFISDESNNPTGVDPCQNYDKAKAAVEAKPAN